MSVHVYAMLGGREFLMTVKAACPANTKPALGLKRALIVKLGNFQLTSIQQTTRVNIVQQDHIRTRTGLCASRVLQTHFLPTGVRTSLFVHAMLGGRELLMTAEAAWLAHIN